MQTCQLTLRGLEGQQPDQHNTAIPALAFCRKGQQMGIHLKRKAEYSNTIVFQYELNIPIRETGKRTAKGRTAEE